MFNRKFKLIGTVVGLVAVLVVLLAMPGVTQENPLSRKSVVHSLDQIFAAFTASEGDVFDTDKAMFYSDTGATLAFIPQHPKSRSLTLMDDLIAGKAENVTLEALYVAEDLLDEKKRPFLKKGVYTIKAVDANTAVFVDSEGTEVFRAPLKLEKLDKPVLIPIRSIAVKDVRIVQHSQQTVADQIVVPVTICRTIQGRSCFLWFCWIFEYEVCEEVLVVINPSPSLQTGSQSDQHPWATQTASRATAPLERRGRIWSRG